jgi:GWxTD domain-containing protein
MLLCRAKSTAGRKNLMFQAKLRTVAPLLVAAMLVGSASLILAQEELKGKDLRWMEEDVAALITAQEIQTYRSIVKDDRKLFREIFWARRDTNPSTDDVEFEDAFNRLRKQADKQFKVKGRKGYATDKGIVFLLLGEPNQKEGSAQAETWIYSPDAQRGIPEGLTVKFNGVDMEKTPEIEEALELVRSRYIVNPTIMYARNLEGRLLEPRKSDPNSPANTILTALRETKTTSSDVPFETSLAYFRAAEGSIYIPILYEMDGDSLSWDGEGAAITAFGFVETTTGNPVFQFEEPATLSKGDDGRTVFEVPIQLQPGTYKLYAGVRDTKSGTAGTKIVDLEVPDFHSNELAASSVLIYSHAEQVEGVPGTPGHAFQFGPVKFQPADNFDTDDILGIFFFVYGLGRDSAGNPNITGQYLFYKDGERAGATKEGPLEASPEQAIGNAEIPLSGFEPGNYKVQVKVKDNILKKVLLEEMEFVLVGASTTQ